MGPIGQSNRSIQPVSQAGQSNQSNGGLIHANNIFEKRKCAVGRKFHCSNYICCSCRIILRWTAPTICPSLWPSGIGSRLGRNRLWVRFLAVSDIYPMFIEFTITWVPSGFSGYIWLDTKIVFKKNQSTFPPEHQTTYWRTSKGCVTYSLTYLLTIKQINDNDNKKKGASGLAGIHTTPLAIANWDYVGKGNI